MFKENYIIQGKIVCKTGLHIGGSSDAIDIGGSDNVVIRDSVTGNPYIPGSSLKGKLLSKENDKRYIIIIISLLVASVVLNVVGVFEVNLLNSEFLYQYKEATYTLAIRSLTEPALFAFFIYVFRHYTEVGYKLNKAK